MKNNVYIVIQLKGNPLAEPPETGDAVPFGFPDRRIEGSQEKGARQTDPVQAPADHPRLEGRDVGEDVGELGHGRVFSFQFSVISWGHPWVLLN